MYKLNKYKKLFQILAIIILYVGGMNLFMCLKLLGLSEYRSTTQAEKKAFVLLSGLIAFVIALTIGLLELKLFSKWRHFSLRKFLVYKYGIILAAIATGGILVYCFSATTFQNLSIGQAINNIPGFISSETFLSIFIYLFVFSILLNILRTVSEHLGPEAFWAALVGKYNSPLEEDRTFIFLDLEASTTIAEKLGHAQYSLFIKDCFQILTEYIYQYDAALYQFVGDEAVLSWKTSTAIKTLDPLHLYFDFSDHLKKENFRFINQYGVTPKFKAAVHSGIVTATKIQSTKSEIVYHGDVLNTCARIMEQCSRLKKDLLASEIIAQWLENHPKFEVRLLDHLKLRGKEGETNIYDVTVSPG